MGIIRNFIILIVSFIILTKSADLFVDSAIGTAKKFNISKLIIGIFLVGIATTAPELAVSVMSSFAGKPEMALGNAVGSVICNGGLALAAAAVFSVHAIIIIPGILKTAGIFLLIVDAAAFMFVMRDYALGRLEGGILLFAFFIYTLFIIRKGKKNREMFSVLTDDVDLEEPPAKSNLKLVLLFTAGLAGILISSRLIIYSAEHIALFFALPETIIALTLVALGTSIPEVATCVIAARKGEGEIAVGNIIGANILNICWVAGASALVHPLQVSKKEVFFMFPAMIIIVFSMLFMMRTEYKLKRRHGIILFIMYIVYLVLLYKTFPPGLSNVPV